MAISHSLDGHQCWPEGKFWTWSIGGLFYGVGNNRGLGDRYRVGHGHIKETIFICMYVFHSPSTNFLCVYIHRYDVMVKSIWVAMSSLCMHMYDLIVRSIWDAVVVMSSVCMYVCMM